MKIFFDTEFLDLGPTAQLVSLGAVREDGATFYQEADDVRWDLAQPWVLENVKPRLLGGMYLVPLPQIRSRFIAWAEGVTEFWAYYGTYDWWLVMQLCGGFRGLPPRWPKYFNELCTLVRLRGVGALPAQKDNEHNALADAVWNREAHSYALSFGVG